MVPRTLPRSLYILQDIVPLKERHAFADYGALSTSTDISTFLSTTRSILQNFYYNLFGPPISSISLRLWYVLLSLGTILFWLLVWLYFTETQMKGIKRNFFKKKLDWHGAVRKRYCTLFEMSSNLFSKSLQVLFSASALSSTIFTFSLALILSHALFTQSLGARHFP